MAKTSHSPSPGGPSHGHAHDSRSSRDHDHALRQWTAPSYDPDSGRAASSVDPQDSKEHVWAGNRAQPSRQLPREDSGFQARDRRCSQDKTPMHKRPLG
jgi:hypothetical protein